MAEQPAVTLRTTYHDTADLRLARNGASLRYRRGDTGPPWTVKLPYGTPGIRREISARGLASRPPDELTRLVVAYTRGAALSPVAALSTVRRAYHVLGPTGTLLAELVDDSVSVLDGRRVVSRFREIEVERRQGDRDLLDRLGDALVAAGATAGFTPKNVRALGPLATEPPDLPTAQRLGTDPSAAGVLIEELRRETGRLLEYDPVVRLAPDDPDGLDQLRMACRRLRTDLRVFGPLLATPSAGGTGSGGELLEPLRALAGAIRGVVTARDLRARLAQSNDPTLDPEAVARLDATLHERAARSAAELATLMAGAGYPRMLNGLVSTARAPRLREPAHAGATEIFPALAATFWERLAHAAEKLVLDSTTAEWSTARRAARRLRRLTRLATPVVGEPARRLVEALEPVVAMLDVEHEADRASRTWLATSEAHPGDRTLAILVGRLIEREHVLATSARESFLDAWQEQKWHTATEWLV